MAGKRRTECGSRIIVGITSYQPRGIDTPADYAAFLARWRSR